MLTNNYCGFLMKKMKMSMIKGWKLRWFELNCETCTLTYYSSETAKEPIGQYSITHECVIEANQEAAYPYTFRLALPDKKTDFILAAPNMSIIEAWMLLLIQIQMGAIKPEENFRTGESQDGMVSALSCPLKFNGSISLKDMLYFTEVQGEAIPEGPPRQQCRVLKRSIHKKSWKPRHIVLENHILTLYASAADAETAHRPRGTRSFSATSRLALLPVGLEGQRHGLALITGNPPYSDCVSTRLSFPEEETMLQWYDLLRAEIMREVHASRKQEENDEGGGDVVGSARLSSTSIKRVIEPLRTSGRYTEIYTTHFLKFQRGSKYSQIVVFENQRYVPLVGWSSANLLLFTDHPKLSDMFGRRFPEPSLDGCPPPPGYKWAADAEEHIDESDSAVPQSLRDRTMTLPLALGMQGFEVDLAYTATDEEGWTYALSFPRMQLHLTENSTHYFPKPRDFVRRRRWVRLVDLEFEREL